MAKTQYIINDTGHQRRTAVEIFKIDDDFLGNFRVTMPLAKYRLGFGETMEETIEMIIKGVMHSKATIEMTLEIIGKIAGRDFRDLS